MRRVVSVERRSPPVNLRLNRPLALGAAALAAVVGGGVAYAATNAADPRDALLNDAAKRLNVDPD